MNPVRKALEPARAAWTERTAREQALLALAGLLIAVTLIWFAALKPALDHRADARAEFTAAAEAYRAMDAGLREYRARAAALDAAPGDARPLRTVAGVYARERDLAITRVLPDETGRLNVWLDNVTDQALFDWLADLEREEAVVARRVTLDREGDGVVRAQVLLARAGGG